MEVENPAARMLRSDLAPVDQYVADASFLDEDEFLERHPDPVLVVPEPDREVLLGHMSRDVLLAGIPVPALYEILEASRPRAREARLCAICLPLRPKDGDSFDRITLGRAPDADVVFLDETVSKLHAEISWDSRRERAMITDLGSRNGTSVDGARLPSRGQTELAPGAVISLGTLVVRFYPPRPFLAWLSAGQHAIC